MYTEAHEQGERQLGDILKHLAETEPRAHWSLLGKADGSQTQRYYVDKSACDEDSLMVLAHAGIGATHQTNHDMIHRLFRILGSDGLHLDFVPGRSFMRVRVPLATIAEQWKSLGLDQRPVELPIAEATLLPSALESARQAVASVGPIIDPVRGERVRFGRWLAAALNEYQKDPGRKEPAEKRFISALSTGIVQLLQGEGVE